MPDNDGAGEIERFWSSYEYGQTVACYPDPYGQYVRYTDHLARLEAVEAQRDQAIACIPGKRGIKRAEHQRDKAIDALREIERSRPSLAQNIARKALADIGGPEHE